jgi:DNA-directed RNA polymerase I, II, and III subunit RPABC2
MSKIALKQGIIRSEDDNNEPDEIDEDDDEEEVQDSEEETESESEKESSSSDNEEQLEEIDESDNSSIASSDSDIESETEETENDEDESTINTIKPIENKNTKQKNAFKVNKKQKNTKQVKSTKTKGNDVNNYIDDNINIEDDDIEDESDNEDENYLQKFDESIRQNIITQYHPEMIIKNNAEIETLSRVVRNANGNIIDPFHKTIPFLTKYEKARILGERANQINEGSPIFVKVDPDVIDGYLIALKEFEERKIPFIIQRPIPDGTCEYWKLSDLEII